MSRLSIATNMTCWTLAVFAWLCTLGTAAGLALLLTGAGAHAELGVALLTASIITPLAYLTGRVQGIQSNGNGASKARK